MSQPVHVAVIGCGEIANQQHLPAMIANPDVTIPIVCDVDNERARTTAASFGVPNFTDRIDVVLDDPAIEAVIIATPPWITPDLTIRALRSARDVLCEKPMALSVDKAKDVARVEAETGRFAQVGFVLRHGLLFGTLRRWIREGHLGSPLSLRIGVFDETWDPEGDPEHHDRIMRTLEHGAPCIHDGAHTMDHLHFLLGQRATRIASWGITTRPEFPRPNLNTAMIGFPGGHVARVEIGWFLPVFPAGEFEIIGPGGIASFHRRERCVRLRTRDGEEEVTIEDDWIVDCFREQLRSFVESIRMRQPSGPGTGDGIASLMLCQAFERGMATAGQPLELIDGELRATCA